MPTFRGSRSRPTNRDEWKQSGLDAQANYPAGYRPVREHPCLFCRASDRPALRARLAREPWKTWYETLHRPLADVALAARDLRQLQEPDFNLTVFPVRGTSFLPVHGNWSWKDYVANLAFVAFLEDDDRLRGKAKALLLEAADAVWCVGGWGGEDYDVGSGWDSAWMSNTLLPTAYDLVAEAFAPAERRCFEARLARDLDWAQSDPVSPRYNPAWFGCAFIAMTALLLGRDDYVATIEAMLDQYVDQVLWGEGEYFEGAGYQSGCMENPNHLAAYTIWRVTGRNPFDNPRWALRARHWVRRSSPLGTDATHSDAPLVTPTAQVLLSSVSLLDAETAGMVVWVWNRIGDPGWFNIRGSDDERRKGGLGEHPAPPERKRRYLQPWGAHPATFLMVPDPLPAPVEPPAGSYVARFAGLACLRTDWSIEALHTCLFAPRFFGSPHSHWDSLTFDLWAHGAYLVKNAGYAELMRPNPQVPKHVADALGITPQPNPIAPPAPWTTWEGWDPLRCFRMAPDMHNLPTIDRGGGNHWGSRADPMHFVVNTGFAQALRVHGGIAGSFTRMGHLGTEGTVIRTVVQVEPAPAEETVSSDAAATGKGDRHHFEKSVEMEPVPFSLPGYVVVADDVLPTENPQARCDWFLHPRGETFGKGDRHHFGKSTEMEPVPFSRLTWTTCDFLHFPPKDVRLEVCLPAEVLEYELKPDACHLLGGSFQLGQYLDVFWRGRRRFWAVLRPAADGETLPPAEDLPHNLGLRIGARDVVLVRPIDAATVAFEGLDTDGSVLVARDGGRGFYVAVGAKTARMGVAPLSGLRVPLGQMGFDASTAVLVAARGTSGAVFVDRPHKQREPMTPVTMRLLDPRIPAGRRVDLNGRPAAETAGGEFTVVLPAPGHYAWRVV